MGKIDVPVSAAELLTKALRTARQGLGIEDPRFLNAFRVTLRRLLGIDVTRGDDGQRAELVELLRREVAQLRPRPRTLLEMAFNFEANQRDDWTTRQSAWARDNNVEPKTVVRGVNKAIDELVGGMLPDIEESFDDGGTPVAIDSDAALLAPNSRAGIVVTAMESSIHVYRDYDYIREVRDLVATTQGADLFIMGTGLPGDNTEVRAERVLGGDLERASRPTEHYLLEAIRLPTRLKRRESYRLVLEHRVFRMYPRYTCIPLHESDSLAVTLRFEDVPPTRVWKVDGMLAYLLQTRDLPRVLDEHAEPVRVNRVGEVSARFTHPGCGAAYGLVWERLGPHN